MNRCLTHSCLYVFLHASSLFSGKILIVLVVVREKGASHLKSCNVCHRALDIRYPSQVDAAVNKALEPLAKGKKKKKKQDAAEGDGGEDEVVQTARKVLEFVTGALDKRSARKPLPDASATLAHAIDASSAELRRTVNPL